MIRIVHLITGLETGGAERMLARLVARSDPRRFQTMVVSLGDIGPAAGPIADAGVECVALGIDLRLPDLRAPFRLSRLLRRVRPDIVQTWLYHADLIGIVATRLVPVPALLWNLRCSDTRLRPFPAALRRMLGLLSPVPDAILVNSEAGRRFHERLGYRPRRWHYLPNGFDTSEWAPDPPTRSRIRAELGLTDDIVAIGLPARFHPMKDHATFFAAARLLAAARPEARFVLAGAGTERQNPQFARLLAASSLADRVLALGEWRDMRALYAALDIVTLCSAWGEGFPNVVGEAMACGLPCAATAVGDAAAVIGDTGLVVPPRDPAALAAAWEKLIACGAEGRHTQGLLARARIRRDFELDAVVARYQALYEELAGARSPQPAAVAAA
jgi:glycosyltransferase involved in cell wall biosynthesis